MCSEVIPPAARRRTSKSPQPAVNNFAATKFAPEAKSVSGRIAPRQRRSPVAHLAKVQLRTPPGVAARAPTSERTSPHEGSYISTTRGRPTMRGRKSTMDTFEELTHFAGFDWAKDHHDAVILDRHGTTVAAFTFAHTGAGWAQWRERIKPFPKLAVAIETSHGAAVEQLLASGV